MLHTKNPTNFSGGVVNNKGQYGIQQPRYSSLHPLLVVGVAITCLPFVLTAMSINVASWVQTGCYFGGVIIILVGAMMSIVRAMGQG